MSLANDTQENTTGGRANFCKSSPSSVQRASSPSPFFARCVLARSRALHHQIVCAAAARMLPPSVGAAHTNFARVPSVLLQHRTAAVRGARRARTKQPSVRAEALKFKCENRIAAAASSNRIQFGAENRAALSPGPRASERASERWKSLLVHGDRCLTRGEQQQPLPLLLCVDSRCPMRPSLLDSALHCEGRLPPLSK